MQENPSNTVSVEQLLAHREWMRRLARGLLFDPQDAEDVAQDAWVETLSCERAQVHNEKSWLGGIVRHLGFDVIRRKKRQALHEPRASRPEAWIQEPGAALDRFALQHRVSRAVLELEEPYRETILLLYFEGLTPQEVAHRQSVPINTVYSRQSRAQARLRVALDREYGSKDSWAVGLLSFASGEGCVLNGASKVASVWTWVGVGSFFTMLLGYSFLFSDNSADTNSGYRTQNLTPSSQEPATDAALSTAAGDERSVAVKQSPRENAVSPDATTAKNLQGTVRDERGVPQANLSVALLSHEFRQRLRSFHFVQGQISQGLLVDNNWKAFAERFNLNGLNVAQAFFENSSKPIAERIGLPEPSLVRSDSKGTFSFPSFTELDLPCVMEPGWINLAVRQEQGNDETSFSVVASPTLSISGRVLDTQGRAISQAAVVWKFDPAEVAGLTQDTKQQVQILPLEDFLGVRELSNASGEFQLERVPRAQFGRIEFFAKGFRHASYDLPTFLRLGSIATLEAKAAWRIAGVLRGPDGRGVRGSMNVGSQIVFTDAKGRFEETIFDVAPETPLFVRSRDLRPKLIERFGERVLRGEVTFSISLEEPLALQGVVIDAMGRPQSGLIVEIEDPTRVLPQTNRVWLETMNRWEPVRSDEQGRFSIPGVLNRPYRLIAIRPETLEFARVEAVSAESPIRILMPNVSTPRGVSGVAMTQEGVPIPNASIQLKLETCATEGTFTKLIRDAGKTDHEGNFEVVGNLCAGLTLRVMAEGYEDATLLLDEGSFLGSLKVALKRR